MSLRIVFTLLEVKIPAIYAEIEEKVAGGMKRGDVVQDMLLELQWYRQWQSVLRQDNGNSELETAPEQHDADDIKVFMERLRD